jgi:PAS domain S-box-containing protein
MNVDLKTVSLIYVVITFVQTLIFSQQYIKNKEAKEIKWWFLWSMCLSISFIMVLLRDASSGHLKNLLIVLQNVFMSGGAAFLYIGTVSFFGRKIHYYKHITAIGSLGLVFILFTFFNYHPYTRTVIINSYLAFYSLAPAYYLYKRERYKSSSVLPLLLSAFFILSIVFILRIILMITSDMDPENVFDGHPLNTATFFASIVSGLIFTFGFVVLLNERLSGKINETKDHFERLFSLSPDDIAISRLSDGLIININESYTKMLGYSKSETIGKSALEINLWRYPEERKRFVNEINEKGSCDNFQVELVAKDGTILSGLLSARVIQVNGEKHIISSNRDVTELRKLERERLAEAEKWEKTFDGITDAVFLLDNDGKIIKFNNATEKIIGPGDYTGKHCWEIVHKTTGHIENCPFLRMKESLKRESMFLNVGDKWFEVTTDPIIQDGKLNGAVHIISDITERYKAQEELKHRARELKEMNDAMIGRELRMTELKSEINELLKKIGSEPKY